MPQDFSKYNNFVNDFNKKYNTTFSISKFAARVHEHKVLEGDDPYKTAYKTILVEFYKQAVKAQINGKVKEIDYTQFIMDLETPLSIYIDDLKKEGEAKDVKTFCGTKNIERITALKAAHENVPRTPTAVAVEEYKNGEMRIRDMVAFTKEVTADAENIDAKNINRVVAFATALEQVNSSRSIMWRIFHPFRNNAEKRDAALMRKIAENADKKAYDNAQSFVGKEPEFLDAYKTRFEADEKMDTVITAGKFARSPLLLNLNLDDNPILSQQIDSSYNVSQKVNSK